MSAAPRTALWGGRDGEGEEEGARERGGPAEGRGLRESGAGKRGRGARDSPQTGIQAGMGGDSLGGRERSLPGLGAGAPSPLILGIPQAPVKPRRRRGRPGGRGFAPGLVAVARKQWGGDRGGRTARTHPRRGGRARASSRRRLSWGWTPRRERVGAARRSPGGAGLQGEGLAVQHADARERREDASELRVACTVAQLTSGSLAAGGFAEAPGRERGLVA